MKVGVLGASGFVGKHLCPALAGRGDQIVTASLRDPEAAARALAACDVVVNLSGESVAQRWTPEAKHAISYSRIELPAQFLAALKAQASRPSAYVSASAIGYYGASETATFTEDAPPGDDFLATVCAGWERETFRARELGMRAAVVRTGVALGTGGGALATMLPPFKMGAGGVIGSGKQWISWVHIADLAGIYLTAIDRGDGAYNATAPNPVTNAEFTKALGKALHRPTFLPVPDFAIKGMLGEGASVVTTGQRVIPQRTIDGLHYDFRYPELAPALQNLLG
ncbi:MAG TPA: TIGR01777 family oxidoreductase [Candidatus Tumulicola sp.]